MISEATRLRASVQQFCVRGILFDAYGKDRRVTDLRTVDLASLRDRELAWVDIISHAPRDIERTCRSFGLEIPDLNPLFNTAGDPLAVRGEWFATRAVAPSWDEEKANVAGSPWLLIVGPSVVVTAHLDPVDFLESMHANHDPSSRVGELDGDSFAVVLLDRMLTAYFDALDAFEQHLDKLEVDILEDRLDDEHIPHLRQLRRAAATFRRLLSSHRDLFDSLRRPDFKPHREHYIDVRFRAVAQRYERAIDAVENARELVVGSYELLQTRLSQRTNETMRLLTFVTVLLGSLAVVAGVLGMNFRADMFESGSRGFWATIGVMVSIIVAALTLARWRGWWR